MARSLIVKYTTANSSGEQRDFFGIKWYSTSMKVLPETAAVHFGRHCTNGISPDIYSRGGYISAQRNGVDMRPLGKGPKYHFFQ
ncbi:hypothetical protein [Sphingobacterium siyangense]